MISLVIVILPLFMIELAASPYPRDSVDRLQDRGLENLKVHLARFPRASGCSLDTAIKRKEWSSLTIDERLQYINATRCLANKRPRYSMNEVPGTRSRYDDFVVTHIQQTLSIHFTAKFLSWHRYYVFAYEQALRDECGHRGYQPYEHWPYYSSDPLNSPVFNGNDSSMSGDGAKVAHDGIPFGNITIPPANGGGCLLGGPFKDFEVHLGPVASRLKDVPPNPRKDGLGYNPRCLRRDINPESSKFTSETYTYDLITKNKDIYSFQTLMQGDMQRSNPGVHGGGHTTIGGDPGGDIFNSPADPAFWLHHAMIDRTWWIWQLQDPDSRLTAVSGTTNIKDPTAPNGTLTDDIDLSVNAAKMKLGDLLDTMNGPFCYVYV
ncbi:Tyrosinase-like protein orsC [Colletotrichum fructicola Nara gc5]|uniref:Tyrosinase-like protein orsC n=1 Tax=Colletotrichum fructicola (strain Nara gc5) TaxID=1213859 RepID=A0A7J6ITF9_COLFN|nr:Tyrosinase-like protein orsC [Colletotrichum fructicola Nara gc5]